MIEPMFRPRYRKMLSKRLPGIREVLFGFDPFEDWKRNSSPDSTVMRYLDKGLFLLYSGHDGPETRAFLKLAIDIANRVLKEKKCESRQCEDGFPKNRGEVLRGRAYASALVGEELDVKALTQASRDFEIYCNLIGAADWDETSQPILLAAIRLALLSGDAARAEMLVNSRRCTRKQKKEQELWQSILSAQHKDGFPIADKGLISRFDSVFNRYRHPFEPEEIAALEMGLLSQRLFSTDGAAPIWEKIIETISR